MEKHPLHIKQPDLQKSEEVKKAVKRKERLTGTRTPNEPGSRIETYVSRLENIFLHPDPEKRRRNIEMLRPKIHDALLIKKKNFPESYFEMQQRVARERGQAIETIPPDVKEQMMDTAIEDQRHSLDAWIDYLSSDDAVYPPWFKFYVWNQVTKLSQFDKERGEYKKRTKSTVAPFPDIYREPLAQIADIYEQVKADNKNLKEPEIQRAFSKKFPARYAELTAKSLAASMEGREEIKGKWVKFEQGKAGEAEKLFKSLEGKGTGWCTAGMSTADQQIETGDFYVYYTNDTHGNPTQPRLAIRMEESDRIGEVRGVLPHQGVEPILQETLDKKLRTFGKEADAYKKKSSDMLHLTDIEQKIEEGKDLTKADLTFLYEIESSIEGFGNEEDPRIKELRGGRDSEQDMLAIFECSKKQIAHSMSEINKSTKAYVGPLEKGIFEKLNQFNVEHIYTSFPEGRIERMKVEIGGKSPEEYENELEEKGHQISEWAEDILKKMPISKEQQTLQAVRLTVRDLDFSSSTEYKDICKRAQSIGLDLAPAEAGPALRLAKDDQPMDDWFVIGMEAMGSRGRPTVFYVGRDESGSWLYARRGRPDLKWPPGRSFVFLSRKLSA